MDLKPELTVLKRRTPVYAVHPVSLWAPLALGLMASCIELHLGETYEVIYPFAVNSQQLLEQVATHGPGVVLFSNYMWTREANLEISAAVKRYAPGSIVIHGGPDTPAYEGACQSYLERYPFVDYTVHSEGEQTLVHLLGTLAAGEETEAVQGLGFLQAGRFIKTPARTRSLDPNLFPSPYYNGIFEKLQWQGWNAVPLETNRGCPYACAFCDWGSATMQKMRLFSMERVQAEIEWLAAHKIPKVWIADSNFGIFERDLEITRFICEMKEKYGYPQLMITNYAKNTKQHLVDIIEMLVEHGLVSTGIVSLQTRDQGTLNAVKRSNIKTREYDLLRTAFESRNLPMSTQLMIGLPGSTRASFKDDLR
ncbi:MAG: radical SAM protein, partial [Candidatus Sericytochromatia bacterium]